MHLVWFCSITKRLEKRLYSNSLCPHTTGCTTAPNEILLILDCLGHNIWLSTLNGGLLCPIIPWKWGGGGEWNCELVVNPQRSAGDFKHSCPKVEPTHFEKKAEKSSYLTLCLENPPFLEKEKYAARIKYLYPGIPWCKSSRYSPEMEWQG